MSLAQWAVDVAIDVPLTLVQASGWLGYVNTVTKLVSSFSSIVKILAQQGAVHIEQLLSITAARLAIVRTIFVKLASAVGFMRIYAKLKTIGWVKCVVCIILNGFSTYCYLVSAMNLVDPKLVNEAMGEVASALGLFSLLVDAFQIGATWTGG